SRRETDVCIERGMLPLTWSYNTNIKGPLHESMHQAGRRREYVTDTIAVSCAENGNTDSNCDRPQAVLRLSSLLRNVPRTSTQHRQTYPPNYCPSENQSHSI
ncbi:unnamed protein product, partial [Ectocarpus fasciculatus]